MASPQTENGWTKIADEILEALAQVQISGHEWRLVMGLLRKTYGFGKKSDDISLTQWEKLTGLERRRVNEGLKRLERRGIIIIVRHGTGRGHTSTYSFQKDYDRWNSAEKGTNKNSAENCTIKALNSAENRRKQCGKPALNSAENRTHNRHDRHDRHDTPKKKPTEKQKQNQDMFNAIAKVCQINWRVASSRAKGQINQSGKKLRDEGFSSDDILSFGEWWFAKDWRGVKGQPPTPAQIRDEIGKFTATRQRTEIDLDKYNIVIPDYLTE